MAQLIKLHDNDNVAIAVAAVGEGTKLGGGMSAVEQVPAMHKIAVDDIAAGDAIVKYNQPIAVATRDIGRGCHVHSHNCVLQQRERHYDIGTATHATDFVSRDQRACFDGYVRVDGSVGTRNYIGIITTVNCSATVARKLAQKFEFSGVLEEFPNVDGVVALTHNTGCGMASSGEAFETLQRTMRGYAVHPNFADVLIIGLGCEVMQMKKFLDGLTESHGKTLRQLGIQYTGGTARSIRAGEEAITEMLERADTCRRESATADKLTVALQCGGSDAFSGVTANPALGVAVDLLVANGGSAILAETPEIYGAEHLLIERASNKAVAQALIDRVEWWKEYAAKHGDSLNTNPSPGNLDGGITTILEKSLGAQAKGGNTNLNGVVGYGERLGDKGLNFMDTPGYDPVSVTGQVAGGANLICFTTGRGSAFGFKPVPSIKLATNTALFEHMDEDMDLNCGTIAEGKETVRQCGERIFAKMLDVASGRRTKSEALGYGDNEFTPWAPGGVY